jgi:adenosylcobinamide kinase/adenosylcobinamide-phosphate guanylyltransferase
MKTTLIIGGARSGKSSYAQEMARKTGLPVLFVATAKAGDDDMKKRIEAHRRSRPSGWKTLEVAVGIGNAIMDNINDAKLVIVDCVTLLVNNVFMTFDDTTDINLAEKAVMAEINELIDCMDSVEADFIIVTNEIGLGLVPADRVSRMYRDILGRTNQKLAQYADEVQLLTAGIPLAIKKTC